MGQSEYNSVLRVVAKLSEDIAVLGETVNTLSKTVETIQQENKQILSTILDAFNAPFQTLDADPQTTKAVTIEG